MRGHGVAGEPPPAAAPKPAGPARGCLTWPTSSRAQSTPSLWASSPAPCLLGWRGGAGWGLLISQPAPTYSTWVRGLFLAEGTPPTARKTECRAQDPRRIREAEGTSDPARQLVRSHAQGPASINPSHIVRGYQKWVGSPSFDI